MKELDLNGLSSEAIDAIIAELPALYGSYESIIEGGIRERYTINDELAILRQRDTKPEEYAEYNAYVEDCKARAKEIWERQEEVINKCKTT